MKLRRLFPFAGIAVAGLLLAGQVRQLLNDPTIWPPDDFIEYWAAARLTLDGENPYDPAKLLPLQKAAGRDTDEAVMMWNPPWSLAIVLPLGLVSAREAQLLWLLANLAAIGYCGDRLWLMLGGNRENRWIGWATALAFLPTLFALQSGQIGPLLLFGGVLREFRGHAVGVDAIGHEIVALVTQYADDFRGQGLVADLDHGFAVRLIAFGHRALLDVAPGALAQGLDVGHKGLLVAHFRSPR